MFFVTKPVEFFSVSVKASSETTYSPAGLTFRAQVANTVPANGVIQITFPKELTVPDISVMSSKCLIPSKPSAKIACQFESNHI
jgi:hypothetical protein